MFEDVLSSDASERFRRRYYSHWKQGGSIEGVHSTQTAVIFPDTGGTQTDQQIVELSSHDAVGKAWGKYGKQFVTRNIVTIQYEP